MRDTPIRGGLWRNTGFINLWGAATISTFGSLVTGTALPFTAILVLNASPTAMGGLRISQLLPGFLFGLVAGAWVDRLRRRPILIATDLGRALLLATIPLAAFAGLLGFAHLYAVAGLVSVLSVFFDVAYQSYLPSLVDKEELLEANSKLTAAQSVAEAAAFSSGGWLVQVLTAPVAILVDTATFIASAGLVARIKTLEPRAKRDPDTPSPSIAVEITAGLRTLWRQPVLRGLLLAGVGLNVSSGFVGTVILLYLNQDVGFDPGILGMIFAVGGVTSFLGALLAGRLSRFGFGTVMIVALVLVAVGQAFIPLATTVSLVSVILLVAQQVVTDPAWTIFEINQVSLRQAIAPAAMLGRVNAGMRVAEVGAVLAGTVAASYLGDTIGLRFTLWFGVASTLAAALALALSPVRDVTHIPEVPVEVAP